MLEDKKIIPYKVKKGNRPKIEEVISSCLDGDLRSTALDFAAFMRENKMPLKLYTSTTRSQRAIYKGRLICHVIVFAENDWDKVGNHNLGDPQYWNLSIILDETEKYKEIIESENLSDIQWNEVFYCGCKDKSHCINPGVDRTALNEKFKNLCCWRGPYVRNPNEANIMKVKRLLKLEQKARDGLM